MPDEKFEDLEPTPEDAAQVKGGTTATDKPATTTTTTTSNTLKKWSDTSGGIVGNMK